MEDDTRKTIEIVDLPSRAMTLAESDSGLGRSICHSSAAGFLFLDGEDAFPFGLYFFHLPLGLNMLGD